LPSKKSETIIKWLFEFKAAKEQKVFEKALLHEDVEALKVARNFGCPQGEKTLYHAAFGQESMLFCSLANTVIKRASSFVEPLNDIEISGIETCDEHLRSFKASPLIQMLKNFG
jgi:hypothetical protein